MIPKYLRNRVDFYTQKGGKAEDNKKGEDKNSENINYNGIQPIQVYCFVFWILAKGILKIICSQIFVVL